MSISEQKEDKNTLVGNGGNVDKKEVIGVAVLSAASIVSLHRAVNNAREAEGTNEAKNVMAVVDGKNEAANEAMRVTGTGSRDKGSTSLNNASKLC